MRRSAWVLGAVAAAAGAAGYALLRPPSSGPGEPPGTPPPVVPRPRPAASLEIEIPAGPLGGDDLLRRAAAAAGVRFSSGGAPLPMVTLGGPRVSVAKVLASVADAAGLVLAMDAEALAAGRGGIAVAPPFLLAGAPEALAAAAVALGGPDAEARERALDAFSPPGALRSPVLGGVLARDGSAEVRSRAAELLGEARDPGAVAPLVAGLGDADPFVREVARSSLLLLGETAVRPALEEASRRGPTAQAAAARTLLEENYGDEPAVAAYPEGAGRGGTAPPPGPGAPARTAAGDRLVALRDLEGLTTCVEVDGSGRARLVRYAGSAVVERREGTVADPGALFAAVEASGLPGALSAYALGKSPGLAVEPDAFLLSLARAGRASRTGGDLRAAPEGIREAVEGVLGAAATLPSAVVEGTYAVAREVPERVAEADREAGWTVLEVGEPAAPSLAALVPALLDPGLAAPLAGAALAALPEGASNPFLVRRGSRSLEVRLLRGRR